MESFVIILDYLPNGRQTERGYHREPVALGVGETELKLLELVTRPGATSSAGAGSRSSARPASRRPSTTSGGGSAATR